LLALMMIPVWSAWAALAHRAVSQPDIAPYLDRDVMKILFDVSIWSVGVSVAFLLAGLVARRYRLSASFLAHVFAQYWFIISAFFAYVLGPFTDLMAPMGLFVGSVALLAALGTRAAVGGIVTFSVLLVGASVAERWGLIPYAPAFVEAAVPGGPSVRVLVLVGSLRLHETGGGGPRFRRDDPTAPACHRADPALRARAARGEDLVWGIHRHSTARAPQGHALLLGRGGLHQLG